MKIKLNTLIKTGRKAGTRLLIFIMVFTWMFSDWPVINPFGKVETVEAAGVAGDIAIYRESTAGEAFVAGTTADHDFDTPVATSSSVTLNVDNTQLELLSGHYLAMHSTRYDSTSGTYRSEVQTGFLLNGITTSIGWGQGYTRRSNSDNEVLVSGGGIIDVASDDDPLVMRSYRTDANAAGLQRVSDVTSIQVLKLNDTWDYLRLSKTGTQVGPNDPTGGTWVQITYDRQDEYDTGSFTHSTSTNPEDITLKEAGHYLIFANTYGATGVGNTDRTMVRQKLTLDGGDVDGSYTTLYIRGDNNTNETHEGAPSIGMIIEATTTNQVLNVETNRGDGTTAWTINTTEGGGYVDRTAITIVKLPDTAGYIRLDDGGTDNMNPTSLTPMGWSVEDEVNTDYFTHPATDSRIEVDVDGDYLFMSALYADTAGLARGKSNQGWTVNDGTLLPYGQAGQ